MCVGVCVCCGVGRVSWVEGAPIWCSLSSLILLTWSVWNVYDVCVCAYMCVSVCVCVSVGGGQGKYYGISDFDTGCVKKTRAEPTSRAYAAQELFNLSVFFLREVGSVGRNEFVVQLDSLTI